MESLNSSDTIAARATSVDQEEELEQDSPWPPVTSQRNLGPDQQT
jgi:hypothetical protein